MINNFNRKKPGSPSTKLERDLKDIAKSQPDIVHDLKHKDDHTKNDDHPHHGCGDWG